MKVVYWIGGAVLAVWGVFAICLVTLWWFGLLDGPARTYVVDAKEVVRIFVEEEGKNLSEEEIEKIFFKTDSDGDGYITPEDFYEVLISRSAY